MKSCNGTYFLIVIEDTTSGRVIGTAKLVYERKFTRDCGKVRGNAHASIANNKSIKRKNNNSGNKIRDS